MSGLDARVAILEKVSKALGNVQTFAVGLADYQADRPYSRKPAFCCNCARCKGDQSRNALHRKLLVGKAVLAPFSRSGGYTFFF